MLDEEGYGLDEEGWFDEEGYGERRGGLMRRGMG